MNNIHRIMSGSPITPNELRLAGLIAIYWFLSDQFWMISTFMHWFGL